MFIYNLSSMKYLYQLVAVAIMAVGCHGRVSAGMPEPCVFGQHEMLLKRDAPVRRTLSSFPVTTAVERRQSVAMPADAVADGGKVLRAAVLSKDSWIAAARQQFGMYEYPVSGTYSSTAVNLSGDMDACGGAAYIGGNRFFWTYYVSMYGFTTVWHYVADTTTWTSERYGGEVTGIARDLAWDHTTATLFGCFRGEGGDGYVFGTIDPDDLTKERKVISRLSEGWDALSVDRYGNLYAISHSGVLYKVDKSTGAMTEIGDTGLKSKYQTTGTIDHDTGLFYFLPVLDEPAWLYAIDLATAKASPVYLMQDGEQLAGLYFPESSQNLQVPAAVTGLAADIDHETLKGSVVFTAPVVTADGAAGTSGPLSYTVSLNGVDVAVGTVGWGEKVTVPVSFGASGQYTFIVTVGNETGRSPETYLQVWAGVDTPASVSEIDMVFADDIYTLSWPAVTESAHGGMFDAADVTYTLTRYPEAIVVAEGFKSTTFTEKVPDNGNGPRFLYYTVTAVHRGMAANATQSSRRLHGTARLPYSVSFREPDDLTFLTILDANSDGREWTLYMSDIDEPCLFLYPTSITPGHDYIFSAPLNLQAGQLYRFTVSAGARYVRYGNIENIDMVLATAPSVDACVKTIVSNVVIDKSRQDVSGTFKVDTSGVYYVAIHGCSQPDSFGLYAYGMSVDADAVDSAPDAPGLKPVADLDGGRTVTVEVTAPTKLVSGETLTSLTKMELYRGDSLIRSYNAPEPGVTFVYEDRDLADGLHEYRAVAFNGSGEGKSFEAKAYIGINVPGAPTNAMVREHPDCRTVTVSWDAPVVDRDGCPMNPDNVSYTVAYYGGLQAGWVPVASDIAGTSFTHKAISNGDQVMVRYGVFAQTVKGKNETDFAKVPVITIGDPYPMPYVETFGGTTLNGVLGEDNENESAAWQIVYTKDQDGDGGSLFYSGAIDKKGMMFTGKITVSGPSPEFSFWFWSIPTAHPDEEIVVEINDGTGFEKVGSVALDQGGDDQHWEKFAMPIDRYIGKSVQFRLSYIVKKYVLYIDNIRVVTAYGDNLAAKSVKAVSRTTPGSVFPVSVEIENLGNSASGDYCVNLVINGQVAVSTDMPALDAGKKAMVAFDVALSNADSERSVLRAEIVYDDENAGDNVSPECQVLLIHSDVPAVSGLAAERFGKSVRLTWPEPDRGGESEMVTDDVERCVPFSTGFPSSVLENDLTGGWIMEDGDREGSAGLYGFGHPNIFIGASLSFVVFNPSELGIVASAWQPRSGKQAFVCLCAPTNANDDWMISPRLSGKAQTVGFYAKSVGQDYNEEFEVLYSTGSTVGSDFVLLDRQSKVPAEWTEYTYTLPEGAERFAIRCVSNRQFALFVDDITFERANPNLNAELKGYNVYRDGELLTESPVPGLSYLDADAAEAHSYCVTAVFDRGESAPSAPVEVSPETSVVEVGSDSGCGVVITAGRGYIDVAGASGDMVGVVTTDGRTVAAFVASCERERIAVPCGIYIVRVGSTVVKVMVR